MLVDSDMFVIGQCSRFNKDILLLDMETVKYDHQLKIDVIHTISPVAWGVRIQPTFALVRVVRGD